MVKFYIKTVTISSSSVVVDYEIILSNETFEGAIGGGRTELPLASIASTIDELKIELENYLEQNIGIIPMDRSTNSKKEPEEDPL